MITTAMVNARCYQCVTHGHKTSCVTKFPNSATNSVRPRRCLHVKAPRAELVFIAHNFLHYYFFFKFALLPTAFPDVLLHAEESARAGAPRLDCVRASEQCLKEEACGTKYRTMRQCVAGARESNFSMVAGREARDECRSVMDALKQTPLYHCRCKRGMKKEKNCLRIYWGIYQTLQGRCGGFIRKSKTHLLLFSNAI